MDVARRKLPALLALALLTLAAGARAEVKLPQIFSDQMVLQRELPIPIWGTAAPGERVTVTLADRGSATTAADAAGKWRVDLPATAHGGPFTLTVKGDNEITFQDVLVGEVWLCSGQSNMEWTVSNSLNFPEEQAAADHPRIRHIKIQRTPAPFPQDDVAETNWVVCSPETVGSFTACGYFMARQLLAELDVPVGLINSSWGGTRIEPWCSPESFATVDRLLPIHEQVMTTQPSSQQYQTRLAAFIEATATWLEGARAALAAERPLEPAPAYPNELKPLTDRQQPSTLYHGMIHPLVPYAFRGAIWYQGESNHTEGMLYAAKKQALIGGWRKLFGHDFPFYYVQIAPYLYGAEKPHIVPEFWEAQAAVMDLVPGTGMVVTTDVADLKDIHPKNKQAVGQRLALWALAQTYGRDRAYTGPIFDRLELAGDQLRVHFRHAAGLTTRDGQAPNWFEIIGPETDFVPATARIEGETVVLSAAGVTAPQAMRFAWSKEAEPNLVNGAGLPAVPFRAGEVPVRDYLKLQVDEAEGYELVYDLDILTGTGPNLSYTVDNTSRILGPFDRIAYFLELKKPGEETQWVYVSMDAFTDSVHKVGVPHAGTGVTFQQRVTGLNVLSNVTGIVTGTGLTGGNIEFWPHNYGPLNSANIPGASAQLWDFGDQYSNPVDGYGSMQVHNYEAKQTLFALNAWKSGRRCDVGIGNSGSDERTRDWTFAANAGQFEVARLRVLVRVRK